MSYSVFLFLSPLISAVNFVTACIPSAPPAPFIGISIRVACGKSGKVLVFILAEYIGLSPKAMLQNDVALMRLRLSLAIYDCF